jgi:hypothetical protein
MASMEVKGHVNPRSDSPALTGESAGPPSAHTQGRAGAPLAPFLREVLAFNLDLNELLRFYR